MALKSVVSAAQTMRVNCLVAYIYADPGIGKTSLAYTAKNPILFDFDAGAHRSGKLRRGATVPVEHWLDVANIEASDVESYQSIVIDTAGRALDMIKTHLAENKANRQNDGSLKLKAQGMANELFKNWITRIRSYGKDVIILAHAAEDKKGDDIIFRPDVGGKNKNELYRQADLMAYLTNVSGEQGKQVRMLNFSPSTAYHAKNSGGLGDVALPDLVNDPSFLGDLIQQGKDHINSLTEAQVEEAKHLDDLQNWKNDCLLCENAQALNELIYNVNADHPYIAQMRTAFSQAAKALPVVYSKEEGRFLDKEASSTLPLAPVTDPTEQQPVPVAEPKKVDVIALIKSITNAVNMEVLKAAVSAVPKDISDKDRETLNRAYQKRRNEVTPMTQEDVDVVLAKIKSATTTEELSDVWKLDVESFTGVITEAQNAVFNTAFYNRSDEINYTTHSDHAA